MMMTPPSVQIDTTKDMASVSLTTEDGSAVFIHQIKLGETAMMTMDQVEAHARELAKEALKAAIAML
ncbi:hypothetical protein KCP91_10260 [Microvirga sp. SRT01]|uniref:Uncharacterized protein n=1 Tax=Sphingomonas longa TaxID=2778730 RepID=A0ABS2D744_9SPHN|nr:MULTISPECIES: hypothetical protein [Alphaproteobacteria]MBM6576758.1 hypothetical protein [Sphingomonas sp. BT552]MBR7709803.1 hypothetical protein [Microvirga sp. SRT01]